MEESTQAPTQKKILLELQQFNLDESSYEGEEAETEETSVLLEDLTLPETALKTYENDDFMVPVAAVLKEELGLKNKDMSAYANGRRYSYITNIFMYGKRDCRCPMQLCCKELQMC